MPKPDPILIRVANDARRAGRLSEWQTLSAAYISAVRANDYGAVEAAALEIARARLGASRATLRALARLAQRPEDGKS